MCEDLVSHELAATVLHEHKAAMLRCANVSYLARRLPCVRTLHLSCIADDTKCPVHLLSSVFVSCMVFHFFLQCPIVLFIAWTPSVFTVCIAICTH